MYKKNSLFTLTFLLCIGCHGNQQGDLVENELKVSTMEREMETLSMSHPLTLELVDTLIKDRATLEDHTDLMRLWLCTLKPRKLDRHRFKISSQKEQVWELIRNRFEPIEFYEMYHEQCPSLRAQYESAPEPYWRSVQTQLFALLDETKQQELKDKFKDQSVICSFSTPSIDFIHVFFALLPYYEGFSQISMMLNKDESTVIKLEGDDSDISYKETYRLDEVRIENWLVKRQLNDETKTEVSCELDIDFWKRARELEYEYEHNSPTRLEYLDTEEMIRNANAKRQVE